MMYRKDAAAVAAASQDPIVSMAYSIAASQVNSKTDDWSAWAAQDEF